MVMEREPARRYLCCGDVPERYFAMGAPEYFRAEAIKADCYCGEVTFSSNGRIATCVLYPNA